MSAFLFSAVTWGFAARATVAAPADTASDIGKIPITTKSDEARKEFLQGRDLSERLLANDSLPHFEKAIALRPRVRFRRTGSRQQFRHR